MNTTDSTTLSYINLFAILGGALPVLCEQSTSAQEILGDRVISVGFFVKDGPCGVLRFDHGRVHMERGEGTCDIRLPFRSPEKLNGMMNGTVTPIPSKGFTKIGFLTGPFTKLTDLLTRYLKPQEKDLENEEFYRLSTILMFHVIMGAVAEIGNHDRIGRASAGYIVDGNVRMALTENGQPITAAYITSMNHQLTTVHADTNQIMSEMEFDGVKNARNLFDGIASSFTLICDQKLRMRGMISQLDNVNRILDRVALYLA